MIHPRLIVLAGLAVLTCIAVMRASADEAAMVPIDVVNADQLPLDQCPEPVQATIKWMAKDGEIESIETEEHEGKTYYEVELTVDGHDYECIVAWDGTLLKMEIEDWDE
ncbi:MAG: hypothetical protein AAGI37_16685 [Planctomycetota bacterium]